MFEVTRKTNAVSFKLSSEISVIENVIKEAEKFTRKLEIADCTGLSIVMMELLRNAIIHGNKKSPERIVTCNIEKINGGKFKIGVKDEGSGFDYKCLDMNIPEDPRNLKKRGYILINELSEKIVFNGNHITVYINLT